MMNVMQVLQVEDVSHEHIAYTIQRRGRYWEVLDSEGALVCLTVYKRGAKELVRRLSRS